MNRLGKLYFCSVVLFAWTFFINGCATSDLYKSCQTDGTVSGSEVAGFKTGQSPEEVKAVFNVMGYTEKPRQSGRTALIDDLISETRREYFIGIPVCVEKYDEVLGTMMEVKLKFSECYLLENIIVRHHVTPENKNNIMQFYQDRFPMLVFESSEEGETYNFSTKRKEKIINTNYHFDGGQYAFFHLNSLRTYKDDGCYEDVITFNVHDSSIAAKDAYNRPLVVPVMPNEFPLED